MGAVEAEVRACAASLPAKHRTRRAAHRSARVARQSLALGASDFSANAVGMETPEYVFQRRAEVQQMIVVALQGREAGGRGGASGRNSTYFSWSRAQVSGKAWNSSSGAESGWQ